MLSNCQCMAGFTPLAASFEEVNSRLCCVGGKVDAKRSSPAGVILHGNLATMVTHHGLHNGKCQPGSVPACGVLDREQPPCFILGRVCSGIGHFKPGGTQAPVGA